jgi:hypothetical protein
MACCPVHGDKHASLSITEGRKGVLLRCRSFGCETKAILDVLGLRWTDLFNDSKTVDPFWEAQRRDRNRLELLERQEGCAFFAQAVFPDGREHWAEVESTCALEARELRDKLNPEAAKARDREAEVQRIIAEYGIDELMEIADPHWEIDCSGPHNLPVSLRLAGKFEFTVSGLPKSAGRYAGEREELIWETSPLKYPWECAG